MGTKREFHTIMVVLTADLRCLERAQRISRAQGTASLFWLATDPTDLLSALYPATAPPTGGPRHFRLLALFSI